ncbi:MAG: hypothetical protein ACPGWR_26245 [Ardenticatenaceae bacterium]
MTNRDKSDNLLGMNEQNEQMIFHAQKGKKQKKLGFYGLVSFACL